MAKKRKTRQQKMILQLKRELDRERAGRSLESTTIEARQGAIPIQPRTKSSRQTKTEKTDNSILSYNPKLIRQDLLKTAFLTLIILSLEFVLYLKLR